MKENKSWYSRGKAEADKGIPYGEQIVGIAIVVVSLFVMAFDRRKESDTW